MFRDCGFSDVVLGIATNTRGFQVNYTKDKWLRACEQIRAANMTPHFMIWAVRQERFLQKAYETLTPMMYTADVASLLLDAEGTWHKGRSMTAPAAAKLVGELARDHDVLTGVTGLDRLHRTVAPLAVACDYVLPQAYSCWKPGSQHHWSHSSHTFPGPQQRRAFESWGHPSTPFVMGLAAYWGSRPRRGVAPAVSDIQSMRMAMGETIAIWHEVANPNSDYPEGWFRGAAYWSGKHLVGRADRQDFVKMCSEA